MRRSIRIEWVARRQRQARRLFWAAVVLALLSVALVGTILAAARAAAEPVRRQLVPRLSPRRAAARARA